jgi:CubicO group peptidase (beta-lactamase class C family)
MTLRDSLRWLSLAMLLLIGSRSPAQSTYFPPKGTWERKTPDALGFDPAALNEAIEWAAKQETDMPRDFSTQAKIFGKPLGPLPASRALTNGVIIRHGYIAASFGDIEAADPTYSIAKSYLSTILGLTIDRGMIRDIDEPVGKLVHDGGYDSPHNAKVTWRHHATQTSEWDGSLFGKSSTFVGKEEFGDGEMRPKALMEPGERYEYNDVRINRFSLSLLRLWKRPLPEVLKTEIMDPIGASDSWKYHAYDAAVVEVDGRKLPSVSGGTRWGAGLWISTLDHARFGLLALHKGEWQGRQLISKRWFEAATSPQGKNPEYGYLWWLNTTHRWPEAPVSAFSAQGAGNNSIWVDPEHDLVVVWRWHKGDRTQAEFYKKILAALRDAGK